MAPKTDQILLGARIPKELKTELDHFCEKKGLKMNFFVSEAIQEKLESISPQEKEPDPKTLLPKIKKDIFRLAKKRGIKNIRVFGSVARGDSKPGSDLDLLVDIKKGKSLLDLAGFQADLKEALGIKVDVLIDGGLSKYIREAVRKEAIPL